MNKEELKVLEASTHEIIEIARGFGLDFYDMRFEICPADIIYTFGAYGMPTRFSHWTFGKAFHKMKTQYDYNLSRIYELVINSDPCYAFLLDGNSLIQNKLVIAHVLGHCDFFKNNVWFSKTNRKMVESMAVSANRIREYEYKYGRQRVEGFLDAVLSVQEHIDASLIKEKKLTKRCDKAAEAKVNKNSSGPYDDLWNIDEVKPVLDEKKSVQNKIPPQPQKDLLAFLARHAKHLEDWQRDIISIIREEMLYFWPQIETKIMNEGWASYWHLRIMREMDLNEEETIEFAKMHAGILQPPKMGINPYLVGLKIWEDIEGRWDKPTDEEKQRFGRIEGQGKAKIFEVRETEKDVSFIRNYLTKELVEEMDLYLFKKIYTKWQVTETEWEAVRDGMAYFMTNCGFPVILVHDADYGLNGELYLKHNYDGRELDVYYLQKTMLNLHEIWGRSVHLETEVDDKKYLYTCTGEKTTKRLL